MYFQESGEITEANDIFWRNRFLETSLTNFLQRSVYVLTGAAELIMCLHFKFDFDFVPLKTKLHN